MCTKARFSVATVAKAKAVTRFSVRVRVVYNLLKRVFRRYSHSTHTGTERIAHQSFLKYLGGISRSVDSSHFVCEAFCYANVRKRAPSNQGNPLQCNLENVAKNFNNDKVLS